MKLEELIDKYGLKLSDQAVRTCNDGLNRMRRSQDPAHGDRHVEDIFALLDAFLRESKEVKKEEIDFEVLLAAICWHDIWKARRPMSTNFFKFKFDQYWDGIGSARVFNKYARANNLPMPTVKKIRYAVLRHNSLFFSIKKFAGNRDHIEARLVDDLDSLEFWSMKRLEYLTSAYLDENNKFYNSRLIPLADWTLNKFAQKVTSFSFRWSAEEFSRRKDAVLKRGQEIMEINKP